MHKELITKLINFLDTEQEQSKLNGYVIQYEKKISEVITLRMFPPFGLKTLHNINILADMSNFNSIVDVSSELHPDKLIELRTIDVTLIPST